MNIYHKNTRYVELDKMSNIGLCVAKKKNFVIVMHTKWINCKSFYKTDATRKRFANNWGNISKEARPACIPKNLTHYHINKYNLISHTTYTFVHVVASVVAVVVVVVVVVFIYYVGYQPSYSAMDNCSIR